MKSILKISLLLLTGFVSCKKVENKIYLESSKAPVVTANTTAVRLEAGEEANVALALNWTNPDYQFTTGPNPQDVTYNLEIDTAGSNFKYAKRYSVNISKDLSKTFTVGEMNGILGNSMELQLDPRRTYNLEARVTASVNGSAKLVSNKISFTAKPFPPPPKVALPFNNELFIIGGATGGGWNQPVPEPAQKFTRVSSTKYEIVVNLTADYYLLLPKNGSWDNKYAVADNTIPGLGNGGDFGYNFAKDIPAPPTPGKYKLTFDFQLGKFTAVPQP
jgi:starch-binding outer membrane protein SusE/F